MGGTGFDAWVTGAGGGVMGAGVGPTGSWPAVMTGPGGLGLGSAHVLTSPAGQNMINTWQNKVHKW